MRAIMSMRESKLLSQQRQRSDESGRTRGSSLDEGKHSSSRFSTLRLNLAGLLSRRRHKRAARRMLDDEGDAVWERRTSELERSALARATSLTAGSMLATKMIADSTPASTP